VAAAAAPFAHHARAQEPLIPVTVELLTRAVSKMPVMIAYDKGYYKKYGLDVKLWMPEGEFPGAIEMNQRVERPDISVDGGAPMINAVVSGRGAKRLLLASTDCDVRFNIVGRKELKTLADLKGKKLGISSDTAMTGFISRLLMQRMGWERGKDIIIVEQSPRFQDLVDGKADAIVADDRYMALAAKAGYPVLEDTSKWNEHIPGNSVRVEWDWIKQPKNRDIAMRFLKATLEGMATYMTNREEAVRVMLKYHGRMDPEVARGTYEEGRKMSRDMRPCVSGILRMYDLYDSPELRKYKPTDFYDETLWNELEKNGFIAGLPRMEGVRR
jgi:NitT/TauT family transport system substrate-binding protein